MHAEVIWRVGDDEPTIRMARLLPVNSSQMYQRITGGQPMKMMVPLKITFRNMARSRAIEDSIREKAQKLDSLQSYHEL
jgi:hypothetical protein